MNKILTNNFGLLVLLATLVIPLFHWNQLEFLVHDNLDSNVPWILNLLNSGKLFSGPNVKLDHIFDGLPRLAFQHEYFIYIYLLKIFPAKAGYYIHYTFIHLIAYWGCYLLVRNYILKGSDKSYLFCTNLVALGYSLLPFWPSASLSIAGLPMLIWAIFNIGNKNKTLLSWSIVILMVFSLYTIFFAVIWFFLIAILLIFISLLAFPRHRPFLTKILIPLSVFILLAVCTEYRLFYNQFYLKIPTSRVLIDKWELNIKGVIGLSLKHFVYGHYHFHSLHQLIILLLFPVLYYFRKNIYDLKYVLGLVFLALALSFMGVFQNWQSIRNLVFDTPLRGLNIRFFALFPLVWYIILAFLVQKVLVIKKIKLITITYIILVINVIRLLAGFGFKDFNGCRYAESVFANNYISKTNESAGWDSYYMSESVSRLKTEIPINEKLLVIGLNNEIFQYHGYKTCGAYHFYIPLSSLRKFDSIFACNNTLNLGGKSLVSVEDFNKNCNINKNTLLNSFDCKNIVATGRLKLGEGFREIVFPPFYIYKLEDALK